MAHNFLNVTCQFRWSTLYAATSAPVIILFPFNSMDTSLYSQRHLALKFYFTTSVVSSTRFITDINPFFGGMHISLSTLVGCGWFSDHHEGIPDQVGPSARTPDPKPLGRTTHFGHPGNTPDSRSLGRTPDVAPSGQTLEPRLLSRTPDSGP